MKKILFIICLLLTIHVSYAQYNPLWIPDTLSGSTFNLTAQDTFRQMLTGNQTITAAYNGDWWGPTMIWYKGQTVHMNVTNKLQDTTTVHWHGMHLPAVMDGGPHQLIPPNTVWSPYWTIENNAATYWYHPHLHMEAEKQITEGLGGLIIVRDSIESALALPRTYGIDDIPLILTDRSFSANQMTVVPYGDSMVTNGVLHAQCTLPAQVVRFRMLDAAIERSYNIGLSDGSTFYVITSDGGLLNAPVPLTRFLISPGERVEILVDLTGKTGSLDLKAYNSTLSNFVGGGENFGGGPFANALGKKDFPILHINIGAQTALPITTIPSTLTTNTYLSASSASVTRDLTMSDSTGVSGILGPNAFIINHQIFQLNKIDYHVPVDSTEIWQITSSSVFSHPFHIHDVEFNVLSINGATPPAEQQGWKDVILVPNKPQGPTSSNQVVRFIARFSDFSDTIHPFMFHCHIALHEDEGMMGQFVVTGNSLPNGIAEPNTVKPDYTIYPNPSTNQLFISFANTSTSAYYVRIVDALGRTMYMLPRPQLENGIDINGLSAGIYDLQLTDDKTKITVSKKFVKE
ncbi:MAG: type sorting protein [Bacteroidetes bacterium]|nr:type sorting protein [Bacteroidota bacterium]